jgi:PITH domain
VDLFSIVVFPKSQILGSPHPVSNVVKAKDNESFVESNCDEQLIITVGFQSTVKLIGFHIVAPDKGSFPPFLPHPSPPLSLHDFTSSPHCVDSAPTKIKVFANQNNAGFDDLERLAPIQEFTVDHAQLANPLQLKFVKFQNVSSFTV